MLCADNMNKTSRATTIISLDFRTFFPIISSSQSASTRFSISNPVGWDHHSPNEANRAQFHIYKHDSVQTTNHAIIKKNKNDSLCEIYYIYINFCRRKHNINCRSCRSADNCFFIGFRWAISGGKLFCCGHLKTNEYDIVVWGIGFFVKTMSENSLIKAFFFCFDRLNSKNQC